MVEPRQRRCRDWPLPAGDAPSSRLRAREGRRTRLPYRGANYCGGSMPNPTRTRSVSCFGHAFSGPVKTSDESPAVRLLAV
jgi:hypothetical protein